MKTMKVGLVGCGAVAEHAHIPALRELAAAGRVQVAAVADPDAVRCGRAAQAFAGARGIAGIEELAAGEIDIAVVASPVRFHAAQTIRLLEAGCHVLCEKPVAASVAEAEAMTAAARAAGRQLGVGLVRRFYPALRTLRHFIAAGTFGALRTFEIQEGGKFNWPAATPSFFDPKQAGGGVLLDAGVHVLDVLGWWLGEPADCRYADDAEGGLEASCRVELAYAGEGGGAKGTVWLSRDWETTNRWRFGFERAEAIWRTGDAETVEIWPRGAEHRLVSRIESAGPGVAADGRQAFTRQMLDFVEAVTNGRPPAVPGEEALRSLRLIERCYRERTRLLPEGT